MFNYSRNGERKSEKRPFHRAWKEKKKEDLSRSHEDFSTLKMETICSSKTLKPFI
jgi:hypothetical protein